MYSYSRGGSSRTNKYARPANKSGSYTQSKAGSYSGGRFRGNGYQSGGYSNRTPRLSKRWAIYELERVVQNVQAQLLQNVETVFEPDHTFNDFEISKNLKQNIFSKGYNKPTPIQDQIIPSILIGRDVIGIANTGTGKTAAFLIPLIEQTLKDKTRKTLILTPTRELAMQIYQEFRDFSIGMHIFAAVLIGGTNLYRQREELRKNPAFVIATPGRLKDLDERKAINLTNFNAVVLDEADRMLDIGFINEIKYFISLMPTQRQSLFFSATVGPKVEQILQAFVKDPIKVTVKKQDTATNVRQEIVRVPASGRKIDTLHNILTSEECKKALVFGSTKWGVQKLSDELVRMGHKAGAIHGNKSQSQRHTVLRQFKKDEIKVLLATDVASRGLDIDNVSHVINFEMPEDYDSYIHRIGRTGRADKKGVAITLV